MDSTPRKRTLETSTDTSQLNRQRTASTDAAGTRSSNLFGPDDVLDAIKPAVLLAIQPDISAPNFLELKNALKGAGAAWSPAVRGYADT